jgi:hypothetical protein
LTFGESTNTDSAESVEGKVACFCCFSRFYAFFL